MAISPQTENMAQAQLRARSSAPLEKMSLRVVVQLVSTAKLAEAKLAEAKPPPFVTLETGCDCGYGSYF
jgi:hypothetical protein